jgi:hypothetical protein
MPAEQGPPGKPLLAVCSCALAGGPRPELQPRSFPRNRVETVIDIRTVDSNIPEFTTAEVTQYRQCCMTLTTRDHDSDHALNMTAHAREKNEGSPPCNWRGGCG